MSDILLAMPQAGPHESLPGVAYYLSGVSLLE